VVVPEVDVVVVVVRVVEVDVVVVGFTNVVVEVLVVVTRVVDVEVVVVLLVDVVVVVVLVALSFTDVLVEVVVVVVVVVLVEVCFSSHSYAGSGNAKRAASCGKIPPMPTLYTIGPLSPPQETVWSSLQGTRHVPMPSTLRRPSRTPGAQ
jgi:hypothetical protein